MTETVVHVTTLEQWKSVLDIWFKNGYSWYSGDQKYHKSYFKKGVRELLLDEDNDILILTPGEREPISYKDFVAQQKEGNKMETYYVTQEQLDLINKIYEEVYSLDELLNSHTEAKNLFNDYSMSEGNAVLRYLGGDTSVEFKVKEPLYRLWRIDTDGDKIYMGFNKFGTPSWAGYKNDAFIAPLEEIKKWQTPAWDIEKAD